MTDPTAPRSPTDPQQPTPQWPGGPGSTQPIEPIATGPMQPMPGPGGPTQSDWPAAGQPGVPAPKRNRSGLIAFGVLVVLVVGIVVALAVFRDRIAGDVSSLQVGDCIDEPSTTDAISEVQHQPCNEPHDGEVFAVITHTAATGAGYPPLTEFDDLVSDECVPRLETYTRRGISEIFAGGFVFSYLYPTSTSWSNNDRGVTCYVTKADDSKMVGSIRAAGGTSAPASPSASAPASP